MRTRTLGSSDLEVTEFCLGTMTFGTQTAEPEAHAQIERALDAGINFLDTAEMYPVNPVTAESVGTTETILGNWLGGAGKRHRGEMVIATKITGANPGFCRQGRGIDAETIKEAVEGSLRRLQTDVIDLYQLHWPNRGSYHFRQYWHFDPSRQDRAATEANLREVLTAMTELRDAGKVRHFGLSNESAWGTALWLRYADEMDAPRMVSIQNEYSLLCRLFDTDLAELCVNEEVDLLAYSPLAAGLLTNKYAGGAMPPGSRATLNGGLHGRMNNRSHAATAHYVEVAERHGLSPIALALAFCTTRPFMGSIIFGATRLEQLDEILATLDTTLPETALEEINETHRLNPLPF
ncbi:MAG: aldo/keto reductase [Pseudomonadota bacterium]